MKKFILFICLVPLLFSCKKTKEKVETDLIVKAMTDGQWVITDFIDNGSDITSDFATYKFQFYSNYTVEAINNGSVEKSGTWNGNTSSQSISALFSGAAVPVSLINGTWVITDNSWTFVQAKKTEGSDIKILRLDKL